MTSTRTAVWGRAVRGWLIVGSLWTAGCGGSHGADARAEIEAVTRQWEAALVAGTPDLAVADVFTEDAVRLPTDEPVVRGRAAIARALTGSVPLETARFVIEDLEVDGDLAFANGTYSVQVADAEALTGKFLEVWKRTAAGWRIHRVMWD